MVVQKTVEKAVGDWLHFVGVRGLLPEVVVAFSGGRDSTVLLHALKQVSASVELHLEAWHVNHQLQVESTDWALYCAHVCAKWDIVFKVFSVNIEQKAGESLEALARGARYQVFSDHMAANSILVTAHHQQDNAETFLHHALRGSGIRGLRGIAPWKAFGADAFLARPLLNVSTEEISAYAAEQGLTWITDPSNQDQRFTRNFIRHEILPVLQSRYPAAVSCLARTIGHAREAEELLALFAKQDLQNMEMNTPLGPALKVVLLLEKTLAQQKNVLRYWLKTHHVLPPEASRLDEFIRQLKEAKADKHPSLSCGGGLLKKINRKTLLLSDLLSC